MLELDGPFKGSLDRALPLAEQLRQRIRAAIESGQLQPGARLPSWRDLAVQLGVARVDGHGRSTRGGVQRAPWFFASLSGTSFIERGFGVERGIVSRDLTAMAV